MKSRFAQKGIIAKYAITGRKKQLEKFEVKLKDAGYAGVISNETARTHPECKWIILYHNTESGEKLYAYRTTNSSVSARRAPDIHSISKMTKLLKIID